MLYTFLDPIVYLAYRVPHLSHDMLPPLADYDYAKNLVKRSFKAGLPLLLAQVFYLYFLSALGYLFWKSKEAHLLGIHGGLQSVPCVLSSVASSLILHLGREYVQQAILIVIKAFSTLMAPFGMNQLLRYAFYLTISMEMLSVSLLVTSKPMGKVLLFVHGSGSHVFSWALPSGPSLCRGTISSRSVIGDIYNTEFLMCRSCPKAGTLVRTTGIVTQLVFEHALRIRVKAETSISPAATPTVTPEGRSEATTPDSGSAVEINIVPDGAGGGSQEAPSEHSTSTATSGKRKEESSRSDSGKEDGDDKGASSNLVGKMNNLVSTDLENLVSGRDILLLCLSSLLPPSSPLLFPLC
jgi:hypothetical protein